MISNKIQDALSSHPLLNNMFGRENSLFKVVASSEDAHNGYQTWHRQMDSQVVDWLTNNPNASPEAFLDYLIGVYSAEDVVWRFPNAVDNLKALKATLPGD